MAPDQPEGDPVEESSYGEAEREKPRLAQYVEERLYQAATAQVPNDLESDRVAEIGEQPVFGGEDPDQDRRNEEESIESEQRALPPCRPRTSRNSASSSRSWATRSPAQKAKISS